MSSTAKNLIIVLALITVAFASYFMITQRGATTLSFQTNDALLQELTSNAQVFIQRNNQLRAVQLNTDLFSDDRFQSLESFETPIVEQPVGRPNPFVTEG